MANSDTIGSAHGSSAVRSGQPRAADTTGDWRRVLPALQNDVVTLREPAAADALALLTALPEYGLHEIVADAPAPTVAGVQSFIERLAVERRSGALRCWVIVAADSEMPVGLIALRSLDHGGAAAEGVAVVAPELRGTPVFHAAASLVLDAFFQRMGGHRIEFRVDVRNGRANGALRKLGASQEGLLRRARRAADEFHDQLLWAIVATDWRQPRQTGSVRIH